MMIASIATFTSPALAAISAPTDVKAETAPGTGTAKISWTAPSGALKYRIRAFIGNVAVKTSGEVLPRTSYTFSGLEYDIAYVLKVEASDGAIWSTAAVAPAVTPVAASPSSPPSPKLTVVADQKIEATWEEPTSNGGSPIDSYLVQLNKDGSVVGEAVKTKSLSYVFETSDKESTYTVVVQAVNQAGKTSTASEPSNSVIAKFKEASVVNLPPQNGNSPSSGNGNTQSSGGNTSVAVQTPAGLVSALPALLPYSKLVKTKSTTSLATLRTLSKLTVPKGATTSIAIAASSKKYCSLKGTSVYMSKLGTCSVTVTVKTKAGKKTTRTVKLVAR